MEYIRAFITGGIICILVQILMDHTTLQPGRIMVILVITGVLLGAFGIYKKIEEFGGLLGGMIGKQWGEGVGQQFRCQDLGSVCGKE